MATYAIGDVQGCYDELLALLQKIHYQADKDTLWFTGDLVNRGPKSLEALRFIKQLPRVKVVLGNHDLHLIALASGADFSHHTLQDVLNAPDINELITWLRHQPLLHYGACRYFTAMGFSESTTVRRGSRTIFAR
jgi:bis(5'-nucleosyl)-tetraphosphatase (symmetrical)